MTHTYKNTLIARLGFEDTDRRVPDHDLICQYVVEHAERLVVNHLARDMLGSFRAEWTANGLDKSRNMEVCSVEASMEEPIGDDRRWTVGFMDVALKWKIKGEDVFSHHRRNDWESHDFKKPFECHCSKHYYGSCGIGKQGDFFCQIVHRELYSERTCIEVKTGLTSINEPLRQLRFYKQHLPYHELVLISPMHLTARDVRLLSEQGVEYVRLDRDSFEAWKASGE